MLYLLCFDLRFHIIYRYNYWILERVGENDISKYASKILCNTRKKNTVIYLNVDHPLN